MAICWYDILRDCGWRPWRLSPQERAQALDHMLARFQRASRSHQR